MPVSASTQNDSQPVVILIRHDENSLSAEEKSAIEKALGTIPKFVRTDPADYLEHDQQCQELNPAIVLLPKEKPLPSAAMERGVPHVIVTPEGLQVLTPLKPVFLPFTPSLS